MSKNTQLSETEILAKLNEIKDPYVHKSWQSLKAVKKVVNNPKLLSEKIEEKKGQSVALSHRIQVDLTLPYPVEYAVIALRQLIGEALSLNARSNAYESAIDLRLTADIPAFSKKHAVAAIEGVANIITVASGKGGVGKSTVSANLALSLAAQGAKVGILDADIYGPSQPKMFGLSGKPDMNNNRMTPLENHGLQVMSIGFMIDTDTPMIWRGPMVTQALEQMLKLSVWNDLDYLIVDLPPGTGDIQLTLAQKVPVAGSVVVTTPQDLSLIDARKAIKMFEKVEVPVLGVVENMSTHICSNCQHEEAIFGAGGGESMAEEFALPFFGSIPLEMSVRRDADSGKPSVVADPESAITQRYHEIALQVAGRLAARKKDFKSLFPNIEISNT